MKLHFKCRHGFLLAASLGLAIGADPRPAAALDFTFSYRGVEGIITGLQNNTKNQIPTSVTVTASPTGTGLYSYYPWPSTNLGLSVANGQIVASPGNYNYFRSVSPANYPDYSGTYGGQPGANNGVGFEVVLGDPGTIPYPTPGWSAFCLSNVACYPDSSGGLMTYTRYTPPAPGPLPILGALTGLRFSRRLKKLSQLRSKGSASKTSASTNA